MALTAPTVASDPATAAHTNTALAIANTYITDALTEITGALSVLRERLRLCGGSAQALIDVDNDIAAIATVVHANPTVTASPATPTETNAALSTFSGFIDTIDALVARAFSRFGQYERRIHSNTMRRDRLSSTVASIASPAVQTAPTTSTNPVPQSEMNDALASATALVDTLNSEVAAFLDTFVDAFRINPGNQILSDQLAAATLALRTP